MRKRRGLRALALNAAFVTYQRRHPEVAEVEARALITRLIGDAENDA